MRKVRIEYFLANRISCNDSADKNIMTRIAAISVGIGICVMIISLAVIFGFKKDISHKLSGFGAHMQIVNLDGNTSYETIPISRNQPFLQQLIGLPEITGVHPYAIKAGIVRHDDAIQGVVLKGVSSDYDFSFFKENLKAGEVLSIVDSARTKDVLISSELADLLSLDTSDLFEMVFIQMPPRRDRFKVRGIYDTHLSELDRIMVITDLRNVQRLSGWDSSQVSGLELTVASFDRLDQTYASVQKIVLDNSAADEDSLRVVSIKDRYRMIFDWLAAHNVNAAVIITIMLIVALFNMVAAMLIIMLERTQMIGILKTVGMNNRSLQKLFIARSAFIIIKGMIWGNVAGIGLCLLQNYTGLITLDQSGYFLTTVPISLNLGYLVLLNVGTFLLILLTMSLPTMIISLILPEKSLRYE